MQKKYLLLYLITNTLLFAGIDNEPTDCKMNIDLVKHDLRKVTLDIGHDEKCEIIIDHDESKIILIPKEHQIAVSDPIQANTLSPSNKNIDKLLFLAKSKLGNSYEPNKAGPDHFDCSGFVYFLYKSNGIDIPRTSLDQSTSGKKLTRNELKKGDILFFDTHERGHVNHSGVYLGEGKFIHSSSGKAYAVTISDLDKGFYLDKFRWGIRKME